MYIHIRPAVKDDSAAIAEVMCSAWQSVYCDIIPPTELARYTNKEAKTALFERLLASGVDNFLLALDDDRPCGVCSYRSSRDGDMGGWGEVVAIYTLEEYWGKGVGHALMDAAVAGLRKLGYTRVMLWTLKDNTRARKFYENYGFLHDGTEKDSGICGLLEVRYRLEQ